MKVLMAWELGSNWGHLAMLIPLALRLRERGHQVLFAVRGLDGDLSPLSRIGFDFVAGPVAISPLQAFHNQPVHGYADVLARCGFIDPRTLTQLTRAWTTLLQVIRPDVVVSKASPLAEFATRSCPIVAIGTGFNLPPLTCPLPLYGAKTPKIRHEATATESGILQAMHAATGTLGIAKPETAADAFKHVSRFFLSWPSLDHFGARPNATYLGPLSEFPPSSAIEHVLPPPWMESRQPISFVYLRLDEAWLRDFLCAVVPHFPNRRWLIVMPTLSTGLCESLSTAHVKVTNQPVDWVQSKNGSPNLPIDHVICHGGHGSVAQALSKGIHLLILPHYTEQLLMASRLIASQPKGCGVAAAPLSLKGDQLELIIRRLLESPALIPPPPVDGDMALATLIDRIEEITTTQTKSA